MRSYRSKNAGKGGGKMPVEGIMGERGGGEEGER